MSPQHSNQNNIRYELTTTDSTDDTSDNVDFPEKSNITAALYLPYIFLIFFVMIAKVYTVATVHTSKFLHPCNASMPLENLESLRGRLNSTIEKIATISAAITYNSSEQLLVKFSNLNDRKKQMEETWMLNRNVYFECFNINLLKYRYYRPAYLFCAYYLIVFIIFTVLFSKLMKAYKFELTKEQSSAFRKFCIWAVISLILHLIGIAALVDILFYMVDLPELDKKEFPIYPKIREK